MTKAEICEHIINKGSCAQISCLSWDRDNGNTLCPLICSCLSEGSNGAVRYAKEWLSKWKDGEVKATKRRQYKDLDINPLLDFVFERFNALKHQILPNMDRQNTEYTALLKEATEAYNLLVTFDALEDEIYDNGLFE